MGQMDREALKAISPERTAFAALLPIGSEHEMVHGKLRFSAKEVRQAFFARRAIEIIVLLYPSPWQGANLSRHVVPLPGELLLFRQKISTSFQPFIV
jgi:hypothetical protein